MKISPESLRLTSSPKKSTGSISRGPILNVRRIPEISETAGEQAVSQLTTLIRKLNTQPTPQWRVLRETGQPRQAV